MEQSQYLTTRELAELLRIRERKVYDLAASGEVPCSKAMGKLLFPREAVEAWIARGGTGIDKPSARARPHVFLGSHDPLLDWALRESQCGFATLFDGSGDGLQRFVAHEGIAAGLHLYSAATDEWNVPSIVDVCANAPVALVEWAKRQRGLIVLPERTREFESLRDLRGNRVASRQAAAGAQVLLLQLLARDSIEVDELALTPSVRTEADAALAVLEGKADAAFGLAALAAQYRLGFVPIIEERFDLLVERRAWFDEPMQKLLTFCRDDQFLTRATEMAGYDVSDFGRVWFNG